MAKIADVQAAVDRLKEDINTEFDAFDAKIEAKLNELKSASSQGDDPAVQALLDDISGIGSDFRAKVQGKTDALSPQVVASAGVSDSLPAAPAHDTVASVDVDTVEAGQNPRLGGTLSSAPASDTITSGLQDTIVPGGANTMPAADQATVAGADSISPASGDTVTGADTMTH